MTRHNPQACLACCKPPLSYEKEIMARYSKIRNFIIQQPRSRKMGLMSRTLFFNVTLIEGQTHYR